MPENDLSQTCERFHPLNYRFMQQILYHNSNKFINTCKQVISIVHFGKMPRQLSYSENRYIKLYFDKAILG